MKSQTAVARRTPSPTPWRADDGAILSGKHAVGLMSPQDARLTVQVVNLHRDSLLGDSNVRDLLRAAAKKAGSQRKLAQQINEIGEECLGAIMTGQNPPNKIILNWLGLEREVVYRKRRANGG